MKAFAVIGPWRGGTSLVTGVLQSLGVFVGDSFMDGQTGYCTYEDQHLRRDCLECFDELPEGWNYLIDFEARVRNLQRWIKWASQRAIVQHSVGCGGKHPIMCKLVRELNEAWNIPNLVEFIPISVIRSEEAIHKSWTKPIDRGGHWWPRSDRVHAVTDLITSRDQALTSIPHFEVDFDELRATPEVVIERLINSCELPHMNFERAVEFVRSSSSSECRLPAHEVQ